jgi:acyl-homoserine-lactone acylase
MLVSAAACSGGGSQSGEPAAATGTSMTPGNGASSALGAIRTINVGPFVDGKTQAISGDTFYAVTEYSTPQRGEALLGYGNWSKAGSKHVDDQLPLLSRKEMRPIWRTRTEIEANLESRKGF